MEQPFILSSRILRGCFKSADRKISCRGRCLSCDEMSARIANGLACLAAREAMNKECFNGGDDNHRGETDNVKTAVKNCEKLRISKGC